MNQFTERSICRQDMDTKKKALRSGLWYTVSNFLLKAIGFITVPIFTRLLTKAEFGLYNNFTSWLSIFNILITLSLEASLISARFDFEEDFDGYILSMFGLNAVSCGVWFVGFNAFGSQIAGFTHVDRVYLNAILVYLLFLPAVNLFQARERYLYKYKISVLLTVGVAVATAAVSVLLVYCCEDRLFGRIMGSIIPTVIAGAVIAWYLIYKGRHVRVSYWKYAIPVCLPYIPHLLAGTVLNSTDRIMIESICGPESAAVYSLAYSCGALVTLLISSLNMAVVPWLGENLKSENYRVIRKFSKTYIVIFFAMAVMIMLMAPEVLLIMGGKGYYEAKYVITPVAMGCVCQFLYTLYVNVEQFSKKTAGMAAATVIAAAVNLILNALMIPKFGYLAAAYTTLAGLLVLLLLHMFLVRRIGLGSIYDNRFVLSVTAGGIMVMLIITWLYRFTLARYIVTAVYFGVLAWFSYRHRAMLIGLIKRDKASEYN